MNAYTFRIQQPEARRAEVELQVESRGAESLDVRLPVWTPGSYLVREHQRHVDGLRAEGYDELADSPFECGTEASHAVHTFTARGVRHELVVWGRGDFDGLRVVADLIKIIDAEAGIFGGLPYPDRYLFILHLNDKSRGGLEHRRSCALIVPRFSFVQKTPYEDFLLLVAHEFFHLWNVKRVRPSAFTPYDWTRENHTRLLWAMEGLTSTYEVVTLLRAGLVGPQRFLEIWAERITQLLRTPGRLRTSLSQASFDAWIKHYRPDESTANTTVSYYLKGSIVGFLLDLELRRRSSRSSR